MPISCEPKDLAAASACFQGIPPGDRDADMIYLLNVISGLNLTPKQLAEASKEFKGMDKRTTEASKVMLLCAIVNK